MNERWTARARIRTVAAGAGILGVIALGSTPAPQANAFGTINGLGQRAEHERITRAALACHPPDTPSVESCFQPRSIDELAGKSGTFGAVGAPDRDESGNFRAHCDDADFLAITGYPQSRTEATDRLRDCITFLRGRFSQGIEVANALVNSDGMVNEPAVRLGDDGCNFGDSSDVPPDDPSIDAKCKTLEGFGRALHGLQDFYSHSNWADQEDPMRRISIFNPPGLNLPAPSPLLDMRTTTMAEVPRDLTTGFFSLATDIACIPIGLASSRIRHACLNKDKAEIDPVRGVATDPGSDRGMIGTNEQKAVTAAIVETKHQWDEFRAELIRRYGMTRGKAMIIALTQDRPRPQDTPPERPR